MTKEREERIYSALEKYPLKYDRSIPDSITSYNKGYDDGFERGFVEGATWEYDNSELAKNLPEILAKERKIWIDKCYEVIEEIVNDEKQKDDIKNLFIRL